MWLKASFWPDLSIFGTQSSLSLLLKKIIKILAKGSLHFPQKEKKSITLDPSPPSICKTSGRNSISYLSSFRVATDSLPLKKINHFCDCHTDLWIRKIHSEKCNYHPRSNLYSSGANFSIISFTTFSHPAKYYNYSLSIRILSVLFIALVYFKPFLWNNAFRCYQVN